MSTETETQMLSLLPPQPPSAVEEIENEDFVKGQFDYVVGTGEKVMLSTAYQAINLLELWNFVKKDPGPNGFMMCGDKRVDQIYYKIEELGYTGHSGCSFGCVIRDMQYIARYGEKKYRENYLQQLREKALLRAAAYQQS